LGPGPLAILSERSRKFAARVFGASTMQGRGERAPAREDMIALNGGRSPRPSHEILHSQWHENTKRKWRRGKLVRRLKGLWEGEGREQNGTFIGLGVVGPSQCSGNSSAICMGIKTKRVRGERPAIREWNVRIVRDDDQNETTEWAVGRVVSGKAGRPSQPLGRRHKD